MNFTKIPHSKTAEEIYTPVVENVPRVYGKGVGYISMEFGPVINKEKNEVMAIKAKIAKEIVKYRTLVLKLPEYINKVKGLEKLKIETTILGNSSVFHVYIYIYMAYPFRMIILYI